MPGWGELLVLGLIGVLIFGRRLPEVGKNIGRGIVEFKKGLSGIEEDIQNEGQNQPRIDNQQTGQQMNMDEGQKPEGTSDNPQNSQNA
ncbi:twin-arginine translocase TatA/TatE family subunit [Planctomycetota bacterium]|nr:twin-arginine translocase TatA/TatE family subunit [Planctomycetota bacterium]